MVEERVNAGTVVIIMDGRGRMLMGKRKGSHGAGTWSFPGGWVQATDMTIEDAARREVLEETGVEVGELSVIDSVLTHFPEEGRHSISIMMLARDWSGTPMVMEPEKLDGEWQWIHPLNMPEPLFRPLLGSGALKRIIHFESEHVGPHICEEGMEGCEGPDDESVDCVMCLRCMLTFCSSCRLKHPDVCSYSDRGAILS